MLIWGEAALRGFFFFFFGVDGSACLRLMAWNGGDTGVPPSLFGLWQWWVFDTEI
jgi:hypothetical protein